MEYFKLCLYHLHHPRDSLSGLTNKDALEYMNAQRIAKFLLHLLKCHCNKQFTDLSRWKAFLKDQYIISDGFVKSQFSPPLAGGD